MARPTYDPYFGKDTYDCAMCGDNWTFYPEDYEDPWDYPYTCPLCSMPIMDMVRDVYKEEGIREVLRRIWIRIKE